jgi:methylmalonyl-CoA/ethylmalonyl-CoA epimerase
MIPSAHRVLWCYHPGAMVADYDGARDALARLTGLRVLEDNVSEELGRRGGFNWIADQGFELSAPLAGDHDGPAQRFVDRFGPGMHQVAIQVDDLDATIDHLERLGVRVPARPLPSFAFSHPKDTCDILMEWNAGHSHADPRWPGSAGLEGPAPDAVLDVTHVAFAGAIVPDPAEAAARLADVIGTAVSFLEPGAPPGTPAAGVSLGDCTLALYKWAGPRLASQLWGRPYHRPQLHLLGLRVTDLAVAANALDGAGVNLVRADDHCLVVDPYATGNVPIAVVDRLLPGDPRAGRAASGA